MQSSRRNCLGLAAGAAALAGLAWPGGVAAQGSVAAQRAARPQPSGNGRIIRVGPGGDAVAVSVAAELARDGDIVEIAAGEYRGDVATWKQKRLTIRAVGGPVRMIADGQHAEGKAIWVLRDGEFDISGIEFEGARVPDRNGAGIRFERGRLTLRHCRFRGNENGLLTGNDPAAELYVNQCEFSDNGAGDGYTHNLYAGSIARCHVRASYFARAQVGQLLKTRARESRILYNRLTDEAGGRASYELEFPNGGAVLAMGNLIVQERSTQNSAIVSYGPEGYRWPENELLLVHNTIVNRRTAGAVFVRVYPGPVLALVQNNLFVGSGSLNGVIDGPGSGNASIRENQFRAPEDYDFRLKPVAAVRGSAVEIPPYREMSLVPAQQYRHPMATEPIAKGSSLSPGAFQD